jgi:hypothetical protein
MYKYNLLFWALFISSLKSFAQFTGGNADGYSDALLAQSSCQQLVADFAFYGGNADGYSDGLLMQSSCQQLVSNFAFYGGNADGYSDGLLTQSTCPPLVANFVFYGGNADGYSDGLLTQSTCPPLVSNFVFYGGNADGYSDGLLTQSNCPPLVSNFVFCGGNADGYSDGLLTQSNCPPLVSNFVFYGGNADGYSDGLLTQSNCPPLISNFTFYGGNADGYSDGLLAQTNCPPLVSNFVFNGGKGDGFSFEVRNQSPCLNMTPLPIELLNFEAAYMEETGFVELKWSTATEIDNDFFTVEASRDGSNWTEILRQKGAGTTHQFTSYIDFDKNPYDGINYYRLKQTDFNGDYTYSKTIAINIQSSNDNTVIAFPSPVNDILNISSPGISFEEIYVLDSKGDIVAQQSNPDLSENIQIDFGSFKNGNYLVKLKTKDTIATKKITVVH